MVANLHSPWSEELSIVNGKPYIMLFLITVIITIIAFMKTHIVAPQHGRQPQRNMTGVPFAKTRRNHQEPFEIEHWNNNKYNQIWSLKSNVYRLVLWISKLGFQKWSQTMTPKTTYLFKLTAHPTLWFELNFDQLLSIK